MSQDQIEKLFAALVQCNPGVRGAKLAELCANDTTMRAELESLLRVADQAKGFASVPLAQLPGGGTLDALTPLQQHVGPYRLVRELGQGSMGTVFLAERTDGQYPKQVAIKLLRCTLGTAALRRRFQTERQILANLEHPNIARLLNGGTSDDGQPYLVMEYIQGEPIDTYCAAHDLSLDARLALFSTVCNAVQYAHQNLVVHCDLKPSNILVTTAGVPKLLDFGIAMFVAPERTTGTATLTRANFGLIASEFSAPEQASSAPITTTTDVYSLGVILYQLLTQRLPYEFTDNSIATIAHTICKTQAPLPSTVAPRPLRRQLRGDLDNIVLKALRKAPRHRYQLVYQLAEDLGHYLAMRPVHASGDSLWYRWRKFLRRNRLAANLIGFMSAAILAGTVVTTWQWQVGRIEREHAEQRYAEVRELADTIVFELSTAIKELQGSTQLRRSLLNKGLSYLDSLAQHQSNDQALLRELAAAYHAMASVQGGPFTQNLNDAVGALRSYKKSLAIREALLKHTPDDPTALLDVAESYHHFSGMHGSLGALNPAQRFANRCTMLLEKHKAPNNPALLNKLVQCYLAAARWSNARGDSNGAFEALNKAQTLVGTGPDNLVPALRKHQGRLFKELADAFAKSGDVKKALNYQRRFLASAQGRTGPQRWQLIAQAYRGLGKKLVATGDLDEAERAFQLSLQSWQVQAQTHPDDMSVLRALIGLYAELGELYMNLAQDGETPNTGQQQRKKACDLFQQSQALFRKLPNSPGGFGTPHPELPDPASIQQRIAELCT